MEVFQSSDTREIGTNELQIRVLGDTPVNIKTVEYSKIISTYVSNEVVLDSIAWSML